MLKKNWKTYTFWVLGTEAVGALSGFLSREGTRLYKETITKPPLSPPALVFPLVWTVLYALMGISAAAVYLTPPSPERNRGLNLYVIQLVVNFFWSLIFFNLQRFSFALLWLLLLWGLVVGMILAFHKVNRRTAWLQVPYLLWLTFAAYLNAGVWYLNR